MDSTTSSRPPISDRPATTWLVAIVAILLLLAASSSSRSSFWIQPETQEVEDAAVVRDTVSSDDPIDQNVAPTPVVPVEDGFWAARIILTVLLVMGILYLLFGNTNWMWRVARRQRKRSPSELAFAPMPDPPVLEIDEVALLTALEKTAPGSVIVECWMQLERDAERAGFVVDQSETSSEFVSRVLLASSVDEAPIARLSELYREARFSSHTLGPREQEQASEALHQLVRSFRKQSGTRP